MKGVYTALITPMKSEGQIDWPAYQRLIEDQIKANITGVIPCGTTGESPTLLKEEKKQLILEAVKLTQGTKTKVIAGTGSNSTAETIEFSRWASDQRVDGILVVTPYYNKPSQSGLERHFKKVADAVNCEVILYNVPSRTGVSLSADTIAKLAQHKNIRSIKEATGNLTFGAEVFDALQMHGVQMDVLSGDDATYLSLLSIGGCGVISVTSNLFPRKMLELHSAFEKGDLLKAKEIHSFLFPLFRDLFIETNPVPIKAALHFAGWCELTVREPLAEMTSDHFKKLSLSLKRCGVQPGRLPL